MRTVVLCSRDGVISDDSSPDKEISFLEDAVEGIKVINKIPDSYFIIFDSSEQPKSDEFAGYFVQKLASLDAKVDGYINSPDLDADIVRKALDSLDTSTTSCLLYVIGDNVRTIEKGVRVGGIGILIESLKITEEDRELVKKFDKHAEIMANILKAAEYMCKRRDIYRRIGRIE